MYHRRLVDLTMMMTYQPQTGGGQRVRFGGHARAVGTLALEGVGSHGSFLVVVDRMMALCRFGRRLGSWSEGRGLVTEIEVPGRWPIGFVPWLEC